MIPSMDRIVVAGGSTAGLSAARELRKLGFAGEIDILDRDVMSPYRRPEVSKGFLAGTIDAAGGVVAWPEELGLTRRLGAELQELDTEKRIVRARQDGVDLELPYDGLVLATGATARPSPFGMEIRGVHTLRDRSDSDAMRDELASARHVVIVGGGFIGLEVAAVARSAGKEVTVVEAGEVPLERVLGRAFGEHLRDVHERRGVRILTSREVKELQTDDASSVTGVKLSDGTVIEADVVLVAIGSLPDVRWLEGSGLPLDDGVVCDKTCAVVGFSNIVAAGDIASWHNPRFDRQMRVEHWTNAIEQGTYAGRRLLGSHEPGGFVSSPYFWSDQFGMRIQSIGSTFGHDEIDVIDRDDDRTLVLYGRDGLLVCAAGMNAGTTVLKFRKPVVEAVTMDEARSHGAALMQRS